MSDLRSISDSYVTDLRTLNHLTFLCPQAHENIIQMLPNNWQKQLKLKHIHKRKLTADVCELSKV